MSDDKTRGDRRQSSSPLLASPRRLLRQRAESAESERAARQAIEYTGADPTREADMVSEVEQEPGLEHASDADTEARFRQWAMTASEAATAEHIQLSLIHI